MLTNLLDFSQTLQENLILFIVLGVIAVLIVALTITLIVLSVKAKKVKPAEEKKAEPAPAPTPVEEKKEEPAPAPVEEKAEPVPAEEEEKPAPAEEPAPEPETATPAEEPAPEPEKEEPAPAPVVATPVPAEEEEEPAEEEAEEVKEEETMKKETEEKKTAKRTSSSPYVYKPGKADQKPTATAPAAAPAPKGANGKWVIEEVKGRYWFSLYANNGQVMLESATPYATLSSARSGIKTYQENIAAGRLEITEHKNGDFQVNILNARGGLLATSSTYNGRSDCEKALESIKRWATSTTIEEAGKDN